MIEGDIVLSVIELLFIADMQGHQDGLVGQFDGMHDNLAKGPSLLPCGKVVRGKEIEQGVESREGGFNDVGVNDIREVWNNNGAVWQAHAEYEYPCDFSEGFAPFIPEGFVRIHAHV